MFSGYPRSVSHCVAASSPLKGGAFKGWCGRQTSWRCLPGILSAVRRAPFPFTLRVRFTDGYRRGRIFHFSTAGALRNGYDSLSQPAATALSAVRGSLRSCVLRTCFAGRYRMGLIDQTAPCRICWAVWMRPQCLQEAFLGHYWSCAEWGLVQECR